MQFFDIENTAVDVFGYAISYVELMGTLFGLASVYYASRANILTWPTGIVNEVFLFLLFFQVQLYADMFLQVYFFVVTIYGWYRWRGMRNEQQVFESSPRVKVILAAVILVGTLIFGFLFSNIHTYLPNYFKLQAAYPFTDSLVMLMSIVATILLAKKRIENWYLWIGVDVVCVVLYFKKGVYFLSFEYFIFLSIASYGLYHWKKQLKHG